MPPFAHDFRDGIGAAFRTKPQAQPSTIVLQQELVAARKCVGEWVAMGHQGLRVGSGKTGAPMAGKPGLVPGWA